MSSRDPWEELRESEERLARASQQTSNWILGGAVVGLILGLLAKWLL